MNDANLDDGIGDIARLLDPQSNNGALSPGDLAELRRMNPAGGELPPALWQLLTTKYLSDVVSSNESDERAFAVLIGTMAQSGVLGADALPVGQALAASKYAEQSFIRLLRARGLPKVAQEARLAAQWCAGKGHHLRFAGTRQGDRFGRFIIDAALDRPWASNHAHAIARDYFTQEARDKTAEEFAP